LRDSASIESAESLHEPTGVDGPQLVYHLVVFRYTLAMTGRREDAEDLTQEVFLRLVRHRGREVTVGQELPWLLCVARNLLTERRRRDGLVTMTRLEDAARAGEPPRQALAVELADALERLPADDREVFVLPAGSAPRRPVGRGRQRVVLREAQTCPLDLARTPDPAQGTVLVQVSVAPYDPPERARQWLTYDLWLVHDAASGERLIRHQQVVGRHGELIEFRLLPLCWSLTGAAANSSDAGIGLDLSGRLRGRVLDDGTLSVGLDVRARLAFGAGSTTGTVTRSLAMTPGETVALVLPQPTASLSGLAPLPHPPDRLAPGITIGADRASIDFAQFFAGSRTSLLLEVRRLQ
jgi:hypothetical protein